VSESVEAAVTAVEQKIETVAADPAVVAKVETAVQTAVADAPAVVAKAESVAVTVVSDVEHAAKVAEAYAKGFVADVETSVGAVIAALINRIHALEAHLGFAKPPIVPTVPGQTKE
jgi:vacuolar-type H+-ATPase subunit E/Vma4